MKLHIDCNTFFASCEIATNPALETRAVVVANDNEVGGGIILALNAMAKSLGLKRGNPIFQVKHILTANNVVVCQADHKKYKVISKQLMDAVLEQGLVLDFVQYSVDEFFGALPVDDPEEARQVIKQIKDNIYEKTKIPVSCGYSTTYTLAKVATHYAKHYKKYEGICVLLPENVDKALSMLMIGDVWGIGRKYRNRLIEIGVATALDFVRMPESKVKQIFSQSGMKVYYELKGESCITIERSETQRSIMQSRTFGVMITDYESLRQHVARFAEECAKKLRYQQGICSSVEVFLSTNRHRMDLLQYSNSCTTKLVHPCSDTPTLIKAAEASLLKIFKQGFKYKQLGVCLGGIQKNERQQLDLFTVEEDEKKRKISEVSDYLNKKFGDGTIHFG